MSMFIRLTMVYAFSLFARYIPVMVSRFVLSIRKAGNQRTGISEWMSRPIVSALNYELPVRKQTHADIPNSHPRGTLISHDIR